MDRPVPTRRCPARRGWRVGAVLGAWLLGAWLLGGVRAGAHDAPEGDRLAFEVERLLREVGSDEYAAREAARARLRQLGQEIRPLLEARREDPDPEIRRTVETILAELGAETPAPSLERGTEGLGLVTFRAQGTLPVLLEAWDQQVGGRLRLVGPPPDTARSFAAKDTPYFEALSMLLDPLELGLADGFDEAGQAQVVRREGATRVPTAFAGPFRLEVDTVTTTRSLRVGVRLRHALTLRLSWSPQVQVTSFSSPEIVRAVDEEGHTLHGADGRGVTYGLAGGRRLAFLQTTLEADDAPLGARIETLDLRARIRLRHAPEEVVFDDLRPEGTWPRTREVLRSGGGSTKVVLSSFGPDPEREGWVVGAVSAVLPRGAAPDGVYTILQTADVARRPMVELSSRVAGSDGTLKLTLRAGGVGPGTEPRLLRVGWFAREEEVTVPFTLEDIPLR